MWMAGLELAWVGMTGTAAPIPPSLLFVTCQWAQISCLNRVSPHALLDSAPLVGYPQGICL
jgi:hypothetical protein